MSARDLVPNPFDFEGHPVRVVEMGGELQFHAGDVCAALGFANSRQALETHVEGDDVQKLDAIDTMGRTQQANHINEPGLYALTMGATKEVAKRFKHWVTHDVLPSIRKTGSYSAPTAPVPASRQIDEATRALKMVPLAMRAAKAFGFDQNAAAISVNQYVRAVTGQNLLESFGSTHLQAENQETQWFTPSELSAQAKMPAKDLNLLLASAGFQKKRGKKWELIDAGRPFARIFDVGKQQGTGVPIQQLKWSPAVIDAARKASKSTEPPPGSQQQLGLDPA